MQATPWYINPQINPKSQSAIIIGGGLAGTSAAYSLAMRGWDVTLIERNAHIASEASGNPFGILTPLITHKKDPIGEFYLRGFSYSLAHLHKITSLNHTTHFYNTGALELNTSKITRNLADTIIPIADIKKTSAAAASQYCGVKISSDALFLDKCGFVNPSALCNSNITLMADKINILFYKDILSLNKTCENWVVKDSGGIEVKSAPVVIIANAADAIKFSQCNWLPIDKVRGQLTYLPASVIENNNAKVSTILCYEGGYIIPEINGYYCVGATYGRHNFNHEINLEDHKINIANLRKNIDIGEVEYEKLQGRVAFRATCIDRRPIIGAVPNVEAFLQDYADLHHGRKNKHYPAGQYLEGLYISTAYGSRGLSGCIIGGEILAAMINNDELPLPQNIVNTVNPARFIIKKLVKQQQQNNLTNINP
jgi:tRNA 5-methylaminomethyl-2-thiouridine biosynthesis bifunctional protein